MMRHIVDKISNVFLSLKYYVIGMYHSFNEENVFFLSSGVAFNGILCLIPLLLLITSVFGIVINSSIISVQKIDELLNAAIPTQPYTQQITTSIKTVIRDIIRYRSTFGLYGVGILIWTSASMFSSVRYVLNKVYQLKPTKLVIVTILENIVLVIIIGFLFLLANFSSWILAFIKSIIQDIPGLDSIDLPKFFKSISIAGSYLPALIMFYIINRFVPDKRIPSKVAFISAFTTTSLWWIAGKGFGWYLTAFHSYSKLYGTYAFILVFLIWVYYSSVVFVVGVIVGQLYRTKRIIK